MNVFYWILSKFVSGVCECGSRSFLKRYRCEECLRCGKVYDYVDEQ
jgi:hypothetical protein